MTGELEEHYVSRDGSKYVHGKWMDMPDDDLADLIDLCEAEDVRRNWFGTVPEWDRDEDPEYLPRFGGAKSKAYLEVSK